MKENTRKENQERINKEAQEHLTLLRKELTDISVRTERLRTCQAQVIFTPSYIVLKSYNTIVAFIERRTSVLYDVLRTEYEYTATSAQHIAKFRTDFRGSIITEFRTNHIN